ncbi:MAG: ABC transporter permease [Pirellulaceae bacterium]|nr:ABC transporter permease [Pirellulaceae bacterium]
MKFLMLIVKNLRRNLVRSMLTSAGVMVLVFVITLIWSILGFLDIATSEKTSNFKGIVTEKWSIPSQMPFSYAATLENGAAREETDVKPIDSMTWQFFIGSTEKDKMGFNSFVFAFCMEPKKLLTMMDELDSLQPGPKADLDKAIKAMEANRQGIIMGQKRLAALEKKVGDRIKVFGTNYRDIELECEIVGTFPPGRYDNNTCINRDYLNASLEAYQTKMKKPHPLANKTMNLVWVKVPNKDTFAKVSTQIDKSPMFATPPVKIETASSGVSNFLAAYKDLLTILRWVLAPSIIATLAVVISNAISISVRERRKEMAVLKVIGFQPNQIMFLVLGEAIFLGVVAGSVSSIGTYYFVNKVLGGIPFPIAFFSSFPVLDGALWWGAAIGLVTSFAGSILPALSTRSIKVVDVFSKVA